MLSKFIIQDIATKGPDIWVFCRPLRKPEISWHFEDMSTRPIALTSRSSSNFEVDMPVPPAAPIASATLIIDFHDIVGYREFFMSRIKPYKLLR